MQELKDLFRNDPQEAEIIEIAEVLRSVDSGVPYGREELLSKLKNPTPVKNRTSILRWGLGSSALGLVVVAMTIPSLIGTHSNLTNEVASPQAVGTGQMMYMSDKDDPAPEAKRESMESSSARASAPSLTAPASALMKDKSVDGFYSTSVPLEATYGVYLERTGSATIKVEDLGRTADEVAGIVQNYKGFVTAKSINDSQDFGTGSMQIRVPTVSFNALQNDIKKLGDLVSLNENSQDITAETVDNTSRMYTWAQEELRLVELLNKTSNFENKMRVRRQLNEVRANLESYRANVKSLRERANFSTLSLTLQRGDNPNGGMQGSNGSWSRNVGRDALGGLKAVGQTAGTLGIYALVFTPVWLPIAIMGYLLKRRSR
jgi:hypothetical protein